MKRLIFIAVLIASVIVIKNLLVSIYSIWQKQDVLLQDQQKLVQEKQVNEDLKGKLKAVQTSEFIEKEARNKLFFVKPGEQEVIIPHTDYDTNTSKANHSQLAPWQQWFNLFFSIKES